MHQHVVWSASSCIHSVGDAPARDVIVVLGASVHRDGTPSNMLAERLRAAAELYHAGRGRKILVSGDHGRRSYDEVSVMTRELEKAGVPPVDIFLDHFGFRTFDSMYRAREVFGVESALVVSNPFHVARAVFLGRQLGITVDGVAADYGVSYSASTRLANEGREILARVLAWADVFVLGTRPDELGATVDIEGDGRVTRR